MAAKRKAKAKPKRPGVPRPGEPGRRAFIFTPTEQDLVRCMLVNGVLQKDIAKALGVSEDTLRARFSVEIREGRDHVAAKVAARLLEIAFGEERKPAVAACIFYLKTRAGWRETVTLANPDGSKIFDDVPNGKLGILAADAAAVLAKHGGA